MFSPMPTTFETAIAEIHADRQEIVRLRAELAAEKAKVADLTAKLEASAEPDGWILEALPEIWDDLTPVDRSFVVYSKDDLRDAEAAGRYNVTAFYFTHPLVSAAVAAFRRKAAEIAEQSPDGLYAKEQILALPADTSALREVCLKVANRTIEWLERARDGQLAETIVDDVLKRLTK